MGSTLSRKAKGIYRLPELENIRAKARKTFTGFVDFDPTWSQIGHFHPTSLPVLDKLEGLKFPEVWVEGQVEPDNWRASFLKVLEGGEPTIGKNGTLCVCCAFQEMQSEAQTARYPDHVGIWIRGGKRYFDFHACGSKVLKDELYRRTFVQRLILLTKLPMELMEKRGHYYLRHLENGELRITDGGFDGEDAGGFQCEVVPGRAWEALLSRLEAFLKENAKQCFEYSWRAGSHAGGVREDDETRIGKSKQMYDWVVASDFPAKKYSLDLNFTMESLDGLETVHRMCGPKDKCNTELCRFDWKVDDEDFDVETVCAIKVRTTAKGHELELVLGADADEKDAQQIAKMLGLELEDVKKTKKR